MQTRKVDVAIIGAGTAGLTARKKALDHGAQRVVVIEGGPYGTTCARVGCMPSKLVVAAADAAQAVRDAEVFGVSTGTPRIDGAAVMQRVRALRDRFAGGVVKQVQSWPDEQRLRGWARFVGPTTLQVDDHTRVEAQAIVIATGTSPWVPPPLRELGDRLLTSDDVFELQDLPESLAVVGAGPIGLELGQAMHRLGVRTCIFEMTKNLGVVRDPKVAAEARRVLGAELDLRLGTEITEAKRTGDGVHLEWKDAEGRTHEGDVALVLSAAGRRPNVQRLELEAAEIELDDHGVPKFDHRTMQCGDAPIFIAGDVDNERPVLHEAADEGRYAGANAASYPDVRAHHRKVPMNLVFTRPQMAVVGEPGDDVACGAVDYRHQGRALVMGQASGLVRIWGKIDGGRITGAEMLGPDVEHTAHLLAWAIQQGMTVDAALAMPYYHPAQLKLGAPQTPLDCGPGD
jgi:dihydrolipoamide dehydrogenase